jgi:hypothetical protein
MIFRSAARFAVPLAATIAAAAMLVACGGGGGAAPAPAATPLAPSALQLFPLSSAVATPPPGTLGVQDISMSFTVAGASQYVLAYEPGFSGTFTAKATPACAVAPGVSNSITSPIEISTLNGQSTGPQAVFQITAVAAGTCALKFSDGSTSNHAEILVTVTQSVGTVY